MQAPQTHNSDQHDSSVFSIQISIGQFLLILLLVNELVLRPLQELFKDHLVYCVARSAVSNGNPVQISPAPRLMSVFGIENFVSSPDSKSPYRLWMSQLFRIVLVILLIFAAAFFERSVDQKQLFTVSTFTTTSLASDSITVAPGQTMLLSPFPVFGLSEQEAGNVAPFQPSGTNSSSKYVVRENTVISSQYISKCVSQVNESYTIAYVGAVVLVDEKQTVMCLDGTGGSETRLAARFFSSSTRETAVSVKSIKMSRLNNDNGFSSDSISGVFAADVVDEKDGKYKGYVAVTKRSHFDSNVVWSIYGLMRGGGSFVWRMNVRLLEVGETDCNERPCHDKIPSLDYLGTWNFDEDEYVCPDKKPRSFRRKEQDNLQAVSLEMFPASTQTPLENNADLLAWLIETDYARFVAAEFFELELRSRVRSDRLFYTTHEGEKIVVADGGIRQAVTMGKTETVVFLMAITLLLVFILVSSIWYCVQRHKLNMKSDIVSFQAISNMYRSECNAKERSLVAPLQIGLTDTEDDTQHLGLITDGFASKRNPKILLD